MKSQSVCWAFCLCGTPPGPSVHSPCKNTGWSYHFFPPGDLPDPGIEPRSPFKISFTDRLSTLWTTWKAIVTSCKARYCSRVPCAAQRRWVHPRCRAALAVSSLGFFTFLNWNFVPTEHQLALRTPTSIPTPIQPLAPTNVFSDSVNLTILGTLPGEGHGNPLQYSCLENPMDRSLAGKLQSMESQSQTGLNRPSIHASNLA